MKKIIATTATLAFAASMASAQVTSANIVGYSKKTPAIDQFLMVAPQFLADTAGGMTLGEAFSGVSDQTVVFTWNGSAYTKYTYFSAAPGWFDNLFTPSDAVEIPVGDGFWLDSGAGGTLILDKQY